MSWNRILNVLPNEYQWLFFHLIVEDFLNDNLYNELYNFAKNYSEGYRSSRYAGFWQEDLYKGKTINLKITRTILNKSKKNLISTCSNCNGSGVEVIVQRIGPMIQQMQNTCSSCNGSGKILDKKYLENKTENIQVIIEKAVQYDKNVRKIRL